MVKRIKSSREEIIFGFLDFLEHVLFLCSKKKLPHPPVILVLVALPNETLFPWLGGNATPFRQEVPTVVTELLQLPDTRRVSGSNDRYE